jgi:tetratricopeptide (TPR) repeat protein
MIASRRSLLTLFVLILIARASAGAAEGQRRSAPGEPPPLPAPYLSALASYRAANLAAAMKHLSAIDDAQVPEIAKILVRRGQMPGPAWARMLTAAILLHTEAFVIRAEAGRGSADDPYITSARTLTRALIQLADEGEQGVGEPERLFARDWYLLTIAMQHAEGEIGWSSAFVNEALKLFPKDPQLTLAAGSNHEILSDLSAGLISYTDTSGRFRRQDNIDADDEFAAASRLFKAAAAAGPDLVEARLRLGRTLYRQRELDAAARELDAAIELPATAVVRYLCLLFRGLVDAARGEFAAAETFYARAARLMPLAQTVPLARAQAAYMSGRVGEAASLIQAMLQQPEKRDPWWLYIQGEAWHFESRLVEIRKRVQQ